MGEAFLAMMTGAVMAHWGPLASPTDTFEAICEYISWFTSE